MNKCTIELSKEELPILINGVDYQAEMGSVIFEEYNVNEKEFSKRLNDVFYKLKWKEE